MSLDLRSTPDPGVPQRQIRLSSQAVSSVLDDDNWDDELAATPRVTRPVAHQPASCTLPFRSANLQGPRASVSVGLATPASASQQRTPAYRTPHVTGVTTASQNCSQLRSTGFEAARSRLLNAPAHDENSPPTTGDSSAVMSPARKPKSKRSKPNPSSTATHRTYNAKPSHVMTLLVNTFLKPVVDDDPNENVKHQDLMDLFAFFRSILTKMDKVEVPGLGKQDAKNAVKGKNGYFQDIRAVMEDDVKRLATHHFQTACFQECEPPSGSELALKVGFFMADFGQLKKKTYHQNLAWRIPFDESTHRFKLETYTSFTDPRAPAGLADLKEAFPCLFKFNHPKDTIICLHTSNSDGMSGAQLSSAIAFAKRTTVGDQDSVSVYVKPLVFENCSVTLLVKSRGVLQVQLEYPNEDCVIYQGSTDSSTQTFKGITDLMGSDFIRMEPVMASFDLFIEHALQVDENLELMFNHEARISRKRDKERGVLRLDLKILKQQVRTDGGQYSDGESG